MTTSIENLLGMSFEQLRSSDEMSGIKVPCPEFIDKDSYIQMPDYGMSFVLSDGRSVQAIQLYSRGRDGYGQFNGDIPGSLTYSMSRSRVRTNLGDAKFSGEAKVLPIIGEKPAWDQFEIDGVIVHVQYTRDLSGISLVTLSLVE